MRCRIDAALAARTFVLALAVAASGSLLSCGADGGISSDLPPGPATNAPPGNLVIYAAMSLGNRIDAFRLGTDGLMPAQPFDTIFVENPRRLAIANGVLYASLFDSVVAIKLAADGSMPSNPDSATTAREDYDPVGIEVRDDILYVAASGIGFVQSFSLDNDGDIPLLPFGSGEGEFQSDYSSLTLSGDFLYTGARDSQIVDLFILRGDGHVPLLAEPQDPRDRIALPDDIIVRDGILYVTSASDKSIRAYILTNDAFIPDEESSRTKSEDYYADILLDGDTLYAAGYTNGRVDLYALDANGMIPEERPFFHTREDPASYPSHVIKHEGILYVAQAGWNRIDAYALDGNGVPSEFPVSSTTPAPDITSLPLHIVLHEID